MPYYFGWDEAESLENLARSESDGAGGLPRSVFRYIEPEVVKTATFSFPEIPGPEPEVRPPVARTRQPTTEELIEEFEEDLKADTARALWKVSSAVAICRAMGVRRVFGSYDGGGDESFTLVLGIEMSNGRVIETAAFGKEVQGVNYRELVDEAVFAVMGGFAAGEFTLRGAIIIDFDACVIMDEQDPDVVFGNKPIWSI